MTLQWKPLKSFIKSPIVSSINLASNWGRCIVLSEARLDNASALKITVKSPPCSTALGPIRAAKECMRPIGRWRKIVPLMKCVAEPPRGRAVTRFTTQRAHDSPAAVKQWGSDWRKLHQSCQPPDCSEPFDTTCFRSYKLFCCGAPQSDPQRGIGATFQTPCTSKQASKQTGSTTLQPKKNITFS